MPGRWIRSRSVGAADGTAMEPTLALEWFALDVGQARLAPLSAEVILLETFAGLAGRMWQPRIVQETSGGAGVACVWAAARTPEQVRMSHCAWKLQVVSE